MLSTDKQTRFKNNFVAKVLLVSFFSNHIFRTTVNCNFVIETNSDAPVIEQNQLFHEDPFTIVQRLLRLRVKILVTECQH